MFRAIECEIDQAVVDKVNLPPVEPKLAAILSELARGPDHRLKALLQQQLPGEHEFRIEILLLRLIFTIAIRRGERARAGAAIRSRHRNDAGCEVIVACADQRAVDCGAARLLGPGQQSIEESTARIGVHLDKLGTVIVDMKILTHEGANGPKVPLRDFRSPRVDCMAITRQPGCCLDRPDVARARTIPAAVIAAGSNQKVSASAASNLRSRAVMISDC